VIGQGYGSAGTPGCYYPTGGGGAGGPGAANPATGGVGVQNSILGTAYYWGGGGGGAGYTPIGGNGGNGGGGGGAVGTTTGGSGINPGLPGGGGIQVAQTNTPGGNGGYATGGGGGGGSHYNSNNYGGSGGSGVVIVSFPTTSMTATATGPYNDYSSSTPGFTTYAFTGNGTLTVTSIISTAAPRNVNIAPSFSLWTLNGGASYDAGTGQVTIPSGGSVVSPLIYVGMPTTLNVGGDYYATSPSPNATLAPQGAFHYGSQYFQSDGVTPATSSAGYTGNGCALGFALSTWDNTDQRNCGWYGGTSTAYVRLYLYGSNSGYASPGLIVRNPRLVTN
jgi:hypothetical protein